MEKDKTEFLSLNFNDSDKSDKIVDYIKDNLKIVTGIEDFEIKVILDCSEEIKKILNKKEENLTFVLNADDWNRWEGVVGGVEFVTNDLAKVINFLKRGSSSKYFYLTVWEEEICILQYGMLDKEDFTELDVLKNYIEARLAKIKVSEERQEDEI